MVVTGRTANPLARDLDEVLAVGGELLNELRGARIFITGGTGFFGCWLLETLLWANDRLDLGAEATVLTRDRPAFARKAAHLANHPIVVLHPGDVRTFEFPAGKFSHVIHAATPSSAPVSARDMFETVVDGTRRTLEFARASNARRFLLTSSGAVYGRQPADLTHMSEDYVGAPDCTSSRNAYGEGKRAAELLCALYASDTLEPTIARCFAFVGPYLPLDAHFAAGNFLRDALHGGPVCVEGDGRSFRSYLYGAELAIWLWTILLRGMVLRPYNVGSGCQVSVGDLATMVAQVSRTKVRVAKRASALSASRYVPDVTRASSELGLIQRVRLSDAITRTLDWHTSTRAFRLSIAARIKSHS
jgi:dTDP-glucose 4,6-dehydratase